MKRNNFKVLTTITGLLLALAVVCSNLVLTDSNCADKQKVKTEQTENSEHEFSFISAPTITPPASASIECSLLAHCLFEIAQQHDFTSSVNYATANLRPEKLLITLFTVIISPNAP
jgi:hypothetical protein